MTLFQSLKKQIGHIVKTDQNLFDDVQSHQNIGNPAPKKPSLTPTLSQTRPANNKIKSFEEVYKTSYSHGLESIYALENVDIKSIRRISENTTLPVQEEIKKRIVLKEKLQNQLEFDFGPSFRVRMDSFFLQEPIQMLKLSSQIEKILLTHEKKTLQDLLKMDLQEYVQLKGMGQGHIDEIQKKLNGYLEGRQLYNCTSVDFTSLLFGVIGSLESKKNAILFGKYKLSDLFQLTAAESAEVRHLSQEKKDEWIHQMHLEYRSEIRKKNIQTHLKNIIDTFVKPWIRSRNGLATHDEVMERLERISELPDATPSILEFISELYFDKQSFLIGFLQSVELNLYCPDKHYAEDYRLIVQKACSYFYNSGVSYTLKNLTCLIEKEFALEWQSFYEGFVEKTLRVSPLFRVHKVEKIGLMISPA